MEETDRFSFGKNWTNFLKYINEERIEDAKVSLRGSLNVEDLKNKNFLDIGCGSGLFSYSAFKLNAQRIVSFDFDPLSVQCCRHFYQKAGSPGHWDVYEGSVLDKDFLSRLGVFDIVYSYGVLHHTGSMWEAIRNSAKLVKPGGYFYFAIYNKVNHLFGSEFWLKVKKAYNLSSVPLRHAIFALYVMLSFCSQLVRFKNPLENIRKYNKSMRRGMNWKIDVYDWIGGYPYEFATIEEIKQFMALNFPEFELIKIIPSEGGGLGNNCFLFKRS